MKNFFVYFLFYFLCSSFCLHSQTVIEIPWDRTYRTSQSESINDAFVLPDGNIVLVGSVRQPKKRGKDGLLIVVEPAQGEIIFKQSFGQLGDDQFNGITVSAEDGSFYIVGSTERNRHLGKKKDAWLLQLSLWGDQVDIIRDTTFGGTTKDSFEKVIWMKKSALIAGYQNKDSGRIWVLSVNNKGIQYNNQLGQGISKDLVGLEKGSSNHYWLCGNTRKTKDLGTKEGDIWFILLDEKGYELNSNIIEDKHWQKVHATNRSLKGNLLIAGESWWRNDDADSWVVEIDDNGAQVGEIKDVGLQNEKGNAVLQSNNGNYWVANTISQEMDFPTTFSDHHLTLWHHLTDEQSFHVEEMIELQDNFSAKYFFKTPFNNYLLVGNSLIGKKGKSAIRILSLKNGSYLAEKGLAQIENTQPVLVDADQNNILSPNEKGALQFTLKNIGETAIPRGKVVVTAKNIVTGLKFKYNQMFLEYLAPNDQQLFSLPLLAANNLAEGVSEFNFKVLIKEREVLSFDGTVVSGQPTLAPSTLPTQSVVMGWRKPDITVTGDRNVSTIEKNYTIQVAVNANRNLKTEDFKVRKNGVVLQDEKNKPHLTSPVQEQEMVQYTFTYTVTDLKEGENTIYVELPDGTLDPIIINYQPKKPNLHILAIGPTYEDLKFPAKDARDFTRLVGQQAGNGFFDKVFIDTLLAPHNTTKTAIEIQFASLAKRASNSDHAKYIKSNDYVMIFFSGHGTNRDGKFRLLPTGFNLDFPDETMVDYKAMLEKNIKALGCKTIIFIDACLSGNAKNAATSEDEDLSNALIIANQSVKGVTAFTSCSAEQSSYEDSSWQNGAFTKALIEGISGQSVQLTNGQSININTTDTATGNRIITIEALENFLKTRVPDLVAPKGVQQIPMVTTDELDKNLPILIMH